MTEPITNLEDAVRVMGALPMPIGTHPKPRTMLDHGRDALRARMTKDDLRLVLENVITYAAHLETRVAELEAERHSTNEALDDAVQELRSRDGVYAQGTAQRVQQRDQDDPARCLDVHEFSPRDGWRMVCGNCDHGKDAQCHVGGGR